MDALIEKLGEFWGPAGIVCALQFLAIVFLMKRGDAAHRENVETLKAVLPLMEKFEQTMKTALSVVSRAGSDR